MRRVRRAGAALAIAALGSVAGLAGPVSPAAAGTYPPPPDGVVITWPTNGAGQDFIEPNQGFTVEFCCFTPGSEVYVTVDTGNVPIAPATLITLGPFIVAADGTVAVVFPPLPSGTFTMVVTVDGVSFTLPLIIGAVIPKTGSDSLSLLRPAIALVLTGAVIVVVAQRRRQASAAGSAEAPVAVGVD